MLKRLSLLSGLFAVASLGAAQLAEAPVHGKPRWYSISVPAQAAGQAMPVRSLATNEVIGGMLNDTKFLAFGTDGRVITLAFQGKIGYVPVEAAQEMYPVAPTDTTFRMYGKTLEQQATEYDERMRTAENVSLKPLQSQSASTPAVTGAFPGGLQGFAGGNMQPGAALYGGGLPGVQNMVQPGGGMMGQPGMGTGK